MRLREAREIEWDRHAEDCVWHNRPDGLEMDAEDDCAPDMGEWMQPKSQYVDMADDEFQESEFDTSLWCQTHHRAWELQNEDSQVPTG